MDPERARALLQAERTRIEGALVRATHQEDAEPADDQDPGNLAAMLDYARHPSEPEVGWTLAWGTFGQQLQPLGAWLTNREINVLGFEHSDGPGLMEAGLAPGVRLAPERLPGSGGAEGPGSAHSPTSTSVAARSAGTPKRQTIRSGLPSGCAAGDHSLNSGLRTRTRRPSFPSRDGT